MGHGLWHPSTGIEIGDVGYFEDGAFKRLFNVIDTDSDLDFPENFDRMEGFQPGWIDKTESHLHPGPLPSHTVKVHSLEAGVAA